MTSPHAPPDGPPAGPPTDSLSQDRPRWAGALDIAVRAGGAVVAVWGAALLAAYGAFLTPFRVGQVLVPVSVLVALCANAVLAWFAYHTTRNRFLGLLPGLVWVIVTFRWADPSTEGDLVLANTWVATSYVFLGAAPVVVAAYRWFLAPPHTRPPHTRPPHTRPPHTRPGPTAPRRSDET